MKYFKFFLLALFLIIIVFRTVFRNKNFEIDRELKLNQNSTFYLKSMNSFNFGNMVKFDKINSNKIKIELISNNGYEFNIITFVVNKKHKIINVNYIEDDDTVKFDDFLYNSHIIQYNLSLNKDPFLEKNLNNIKGEFLIEVQYNKYFIKNNGTRIYEGHF